MSLEASCARLPLAALRHLAALRARPDLLVLVQGDLAWAFWPPAVGRHRHRPATRGPGGSELRRPGPGARPTPATAWWWRALLGANGADSARLSAGAGLARGRAERGAGAGGERGGRAEWRGRRG